MRQIGTVSSEQEAQTLVDYLLTQGIEGSSDPVGSKYELWIRDEDHLDRAKAILNEFQHAPQDAKFKAASKSALEIRRKDAARKKEIAKNQIQMSRNWSRQGQARQVPVTMTLIVVSILIAIFTGWGNPPSNPDGKGSFGASLLNTLAFLDLPGIKNSLESLGDGKPKSFADQMLIRAAQSADSGGLALDDQPAFRCWSLLRGQFWRVLSPCVTHFGIMHILFNMWMLYVLGSGLESRVGSLRYLVFVIACGAISNFLQGTMPLAIDGSYRFGGMSGVVYGLFGWVLMRQMFGRSQGMMLSQFSIIFIVGWLFAGIFHMVPNIANWCHGVGFAVGLFTGYFPEILRRR